MSTILNDYDMADLLAERTGFSRETCKYVVSIITRKIREKLVYERGLRAPWLGYFYESEQGCKGWHHSGFNHSKDTRICKKTRLKYREPQWWSEQKRREALLKTRKRLTKSTP